MKLIICNICKEAMQYHQDLPSDLSKPGKEISITNGSYYADVCYECAERVEEFIDTLKKPLEENIKIKKSNE